MNERYNDWINNSQEWRDELEKALENNGGNDVVTQYRNVALAFPSNEPSPCSFDYPLINPKRFISWAESKGWKVHPVSEMADEEDTHRSQIRLTKNSPYDGTI